MLGLARLGDDETVTVAGEGTIPISADNPIYITYDPNVVPEVGGGTPYVAGVTTLPDSSASPTGLSAGSFFGLVAVAIVGVFALGALK